MDTNDSRSRRSPSTSVTDFTWVSNGRRRSYSKNTLNDWLRNYSAGTAETAKVEARAEVVQEVRARETAAKQTERIVSQIQGEFTGWKGKTVFPLKNGQVWQQRIGGQLSHKAVEPKVEITKNLLGFYVMHLVGTSYTVGVKRVN